MQHQQNILPCLTYNKQSYCKDLHNFKFTRSLAFVKDNFRESIGIVELKMILKYQIFLVKRYFIQTIGRWYFYQNHRLLTNSQHLRYHVSTQNSQHLMFLIPFITSKYPMMLEIHLELFQKQYNNLIKKVFLTYQKGKALKRGGWTHRMTTPLHSANMQIIISTHNFSLGRPILVLILTIKSKICAYLYV